MSDNNVVRAIKDYIGDDTSTYDVKNMILSAIKGLRP